MSSTQPAQPAAAAAAAAAAPPAATQPPKPREEPEGMHEEAALLEAFAQIPSIGRGWCFPQPGGAARVALQVAQRNLAANAQRKYLLQFPLSEATLEQGGEVEAGMPTELKDVAMLAPSPSGKRTLIVRSGTGETSAVLEVWGRGRLLKELHVPKALHGSIYNDGWFGAGAAWSPDETRLAYVAEAPAASKTPEWGARPGAAGKKWEGAGPKGWRGVGEWSEDWGELNTGKRHPALFVLDLAAWEVAAVGGLPEDSSCGQPVWAPEGDMLLFVVWQHLSSNFPALSQRLGIVFCFNRPCALYAVRWPQQAQQERPKPGAAGSEAGTAGMAGAAASAAEGIGHAAPAASAAAGAPAAVPAAVCLTPTLGSAFSPRFGPPAQQAQQMLAFLSQQAAVTTGVHSATCSLHTLSWQAVRQALDAGGGAPLPTPRTVVDPVWNALGDEFPGLYCNALPEQPFLPTGEGSEAGLVLTTQWRSLTAVVAVGLGSGRVSRLSPANGASWSLVAAAEGWLLAQESSPSLPAQLYTAHLTPGDAHTLHTPPGPPAAAAAAAPLCWSRVALPGWEEGGDDVAEVKAHLERIGVDVMRLTPSVGPREVPYEAVVLHRKDLPGPRPTILTPHGGPHSAYAASFFMPLSFMVALGYNVVLLNYRGSVGFGEASIQSLPGHIGTNDVADCWDSLQAAIDKGYVDPSQVAVVGGSHGGFLTGHLLGQHASAFRAGVLRNPVCDVSLMVHVSDIPDWCFVEGYGTEEGRRRAAAKATPEDLHRLRSISPAAHLHKVSAPMLFLLGAKDRRVPHEDARQYVAALRARRDAPETRVMVFPEDTHALDRPQTEYEQWLNAAWWLRRHMG